MRIKNILFSLFVILAFSACNDDTDPRMDVPAPATLDKISSSSIVLTEDNASEVVLSLKWKADKPVLSVPTDFVILIDKAGNEFQKPKLLGYTSEMTYSINGGDLNSFVVKTFEQDPLTIQKYELRVASRAIGKDDARAILLESASLPQTVEITTMELVIPKPALYIVGDALVGWDNSFAGVGADLQVFFADNSSMKDLKYTYTGFFKGAGGLKFPTIAGDWDTAYGYKAGVIAFGGENMPAPEADGIYTLTVDTKALTASYTKYTGSAKEQTLVGIIGDAANGWGDNDDVLMTKVAKYVWIAKDVALKAGTIKFRADHKWDTQWGGVKVEGDVKQELPFHINGGENIDIPKAGSYYVAINTLTGHHAIILMAELPKK